ncbi:galactosylceramide sulfotransferase-like [Antedon mediterranea]|uniref:galactosylceramide sulfotransferase-like n=1 Tax=Antedon mediterranea TaxID=105859 RepID=UPI003AF9FD8F
MGSIHFGNRNFEYKSHKMFLPPPNVTKGDYSNYKYNIFTLHVRYNRSVLNTFMKKDPVHITIIREPSAQLESSFMFFHLVKYVNSTAEGIPPFEAFVSNPTKYRKASSSIIGYNNQIFDLGLSRKSFRNDTIINKTIARLDQDMDLVLINEFYDESLVLLSKLLCWSLEDVLYLPKNMRPTSKKNAMSEEIREKARKRNHADTLLYNHFLKRLHERIVDYGPSFEADLWRFRNMTSKLRLKCVDGQVSVKEIQNRERQLIRMRRKGFGR